MFLMLHPAPTKSLHDYILSIPNAIPLDLCDAILAEYKEFQVARTAGDDPLLTEKGDYRRCRTIQLSVDETISKNPEIRTHLDQRLFEEMAGPALRTYQEVHPHAEIITGDSGYELIQYESGDFYKNHVDHLPHKPRSLSLSVVLNDDFDGGDLSFFGGSLDLQIPKGSGVMFPSNFMYDHQVKPVTSGTRYSIITWYN